MKTTSCVLLAVCLGWVAALHADDVVPPKTHPDSAHWQDLFRKDLSNATFPKGTWYFQGDILNATGDQYLWTKKKYRNFIVDLKFKTSRAPTAACLSTAITSRDRIGFRAKWKSRLTTTTRRATPTARRSASAARFMVTWPPPKAP